MLFIINLLRCSVLLSTAEGVTKGLSLNLEETSSLFM